MARFDVYRLGGALLVDCQADAWSDLDTRLVVPLISIEDTPRVDRKLNPVFVIDGKTMVLHPNVAATVRRQELRQPIAS